MMDVWRKTLAYFGLADEEEYEDYEEEEEDLEDAVYREAPTTVRRIQRAPDMNRVKRTAALRSVSAPPGRVHLVEPRNFNDAQRIADKFKANVPVILNLQQNDADLSKRLIDFASGLTYGLNGGMQRIAEKVFLLIPSNVEVSAEEKRRLQERGFFNQF